MKIKFDAVITTTLVACAVITTGIVLDREFLTRSTAPVPVEQRPVQISNWRDDLAKGFRLGPPAAPVQLIEFADFECPFCGDLHKKLKFLRERYPKQLALTYIHFPLSMHRFALPAARVSECAADQGRFEAMYGELFDGQESFGLKPWGEYAKAAGVPDLEVFDACVKKTDPIPRVVEGKALGAKLDVKETPTLIINGWKLGRPPTAEELDQMVRRVLAGKSPVDGKS